MACRHLRRQLTGRYLAGLLVSLAIPVVWVRQVATVPGDVAHASTPQWTVEALTPEDAERARQFTDRFMARLAETRDFTPLVSEFFVDDFPDRLVAQLTTTAGPPVHLRSLTLFWLEAHVAGGLTPEARLSYYLEHVNFWYLRSLSTLGRHTLQDLQRMERFADGLPGTVVATLQASPLVEPLLARRFGDAVTSRSDGTKVTAGSVDEALDGIEVLRRASMLLREDVAGSEAENSTAYRELRRQFEMALQQRGAPSAMSRVQACASACGSLPAGSRVIEIAAHPALHFHLVNVDGQLRALLVDLMAE